MNIQKLVISLFLVMSWSSLARSGSELYYYGAKNGMDLIGPYLKYNFLTPPYSFGLSKFTKDDIMLELKSGEDGASFLEARWPRYLLQSGELKIFDVVSKEIDSFSFERDDISVAEKKRFFSYRIPLSVKKLSSHLEKGLHFCVGQNDGDYKIQICSDKLNLASNQFKPLRQTNDVAVVVNGAKVPTNAQIYLPAKHKTVELLVKFRSGLKIWVQEPVYSLDPKKVVILPKTKEIAIQHKELSRTPKIAKLKDRVKGLLSEKNYLLEKLDTSRLKTIPIVDTEMEFSPFREGRSLQIFGLSLDELPSAEAPLKLDPKGLVATYSSEVSIKGHKVPGSLVSADPPNKIINIDSENFLWTFHVPEKGEFNQGLIAAKASDKDEKKYYSNRIFRGHRGSIALRAAFTSSLTGAAVPGGHLQADYWGEKLLSDAPLFFQRWGIGAQHSQAFSKFTIKGLEGDLQYSSTSVDLMARFSSGVRPLESSFGVKARYFQFSMLGGELGDINPSLLGAGLFWHTAPQGLVDAAVSAVPFFRKPKWMELAFLVYPLTTTADHKITMAYSFHARGRLLFAQNWFLDGALNYHNVSVERERFNAGVSFVEGSLGLGYSF